mgnify:CR=1 FL=1
MDKHSARRPIDEEPASGGPDGGDPPGTDLGDGVEAPGVDQVASAGVPVADGGPTDIEGAVQLERDKYLRLAAEFDNFSKRSARERQESGWRAQGDLVLGLVEVLDDIMRFAHLDPATVESATVVQGVALVEKKIFKTLGGHGLELVNPVDQIFDPAFHEAVGTEPALSREDDHLVARVYQSGYVFRGQLLRPARVVVKQWLG